MKSFSEPQYGSKSFSKDKGQSPASPCTPGKSDDGEGPHIKETSGEQGGRVQRGNKLIALEVSAIEGKYAFHSVNVHEGDEPRVIDLDALDFVVAEDGVFLP